MRCLKDVLEYMLRMKENTNILDVDTPDVTVTLRFSTDGAKMSKKITAVRGVVYLVNDRDKITLHSPDDEVTLFLYTGKYF